MIFLPRAYNKDDINDSNLIDLLSISYREHKRMLNEVEDGYRKMDHEHEKNSRKICHRVEGVVANMPREIRLILEAEVLENKKGTKWYKEFYSMAQYYSKRKIAYRKFIDAINK